MQTMLLQTKTVKPATIALTEFAEVLNISTHTAYRSVRETGELAGIPVIIVGKSYRFSTAAIENLLGPLSFETNAA